jgi:hypothetical protein
MIAYPPGYASWTRDMQDAFYATQRRPNGNGTHYAPPPTGPEDYGVAADSPAHGNRGTTAKFKVERWSEIGFDINTEWLIKGVLPLQGVGLIYGKSQSFKSFVAMHMALSVTLGSLWAGKRVEKMPAVYIAAEGAGGLRKRKAGYIKTWKDLPDEVDFHLISAAPNLGTEKGDLEALIASIDGAGVKPGLIIIDTVAKAIGAGDENGQGMATLLANAEALSQRFGCLVLCVHHVGHGEDAQNRPRGWSGLVAALDVQILCERAEGAMSVRLTVQKLKDDACNVALTAHLSRVVLGTDSDGDEVSTLVVDDVVKAEAIAKGDAKGPVGPSGVS